MLCQQFLLKLKTLFRVYKVRQTHDIRKRKMSGYHKKLSGSVLISSTTLDYPLWIVVGQIFLNCSLVATE